MVQAIFNPEGTEVILGIEEPTHMSYKILEIGNDNTTVDDNLPNDITNIYYTNNHSVVYTSKTSSGLGGYSYNTTTGLPTLLWEIPLQQVVVYWTATDTYVVPEVGAELLGGLYKIANSRLIPAGDQHYAYSVLINDAGDLVLETYFDIDKNSLTSQTRKLTTGDNDTKPFPFIAIPEKCAINTNNSDIAWCGSPNQTKAARTFVTDWYSGQNSLNDSLWVTNRAVIPAREMVNFTDFLGYEIDIAQMNIDEQGDYLFFKNKNNDTLWKYRIK